MKSERLVRELFPNIPCPEYTKKLRLSSDALYYIKKYGSKEKAIEYLMNRCGMCAIDDCFCEYPEIIKILKEI